jgi:hypothetical protein
VSVFVLDLSEPRDPTLLARLREAPSVVANYTIGTVIVMAQLVLADHLRRKALPAHVRAAPVPRPTVR